MVERMSDALAPWLQQQLHPLLPRRGHAWLLQGPSGLGQYSLALALARAWLCVQPTEQGACGQCHSCHAVEVRTHPDLCVLMPETLSLALGWPLDEATQDKLDKKERKPSKEIRVEAARQMVSFSQHTRSGGTTKVVLVYPAERMNTVTANTILKTLEEPPGETRFVLASEAAHLLLPTIRSRCQTHTLAWPAEAEALAWLQQQGLSAADAPVLLRAAGGRPEDALSLAAQGFNAASWTALPKAVARGDTSALADAAPGVLIATLQKLCHDMMAASAGASPRFFAPNDLPTAPAMDALTQWSRDLSQSARTAEHPFNFGLMLEAQIARARSALLVRAAA
jgi:DNA polymerase-3 subunit delta'